MVNATDLSGKVAFDANSLNNLKQAAKENSPEAIKQVARQFEAIFMNMMLKSMRDASPQDNPFDNEQSRTFTSMLDQQLTSNLASKGLGLADILAKQLSQTGYKNNVMSEPVSSDQPELGATSPLNTNSLINHVAPSLTKAQQGGTVSNSLKLNENSLIHNKTSSDGSNDFYSKMASHAEEASKISGIPAHLMLGQAALESGWGKREIKGADGTSSNNLFGIKATGNWDGKVVEAFTTEYINGVKQKRIEKFRAYDNYTDSFKDFANLMRNNPRYEKVMTNLNSVSEYAQAMQKAGYATDPNYAAKLNSVIRKLTS